MFGLYRIKKWFDFVPRPLKNIYVVLILSFGIWMLVFDKQSVITHIKLSNTINQIYEEMEFYEEEIDRIETERARMDADTDRYVREKYHMSKENEDVFVIRRK